MAASVLIVEDDAMIALGVERQLRADGYEVCGIARTQAEVRQFAEMHNPEVALVDVRLGSESDGLEAAGYLSAHGTKVLFATGYWAGLVGRVDGTVACLTKPYDVKWVRPAIELMLEAAGAGTIPATRSPGLVFFGP